jgi:hypothetical protein
MDGRQVPAVSKQLEGQLTKELDMDLVLRLLADRQQSQRERVSKPVMPTLSDRQIPVDRVNSREFLGGQGRYKNMNCLRCHIQEPGKFVIPTFNYGSVDRYSGGESYEVTESPSQREAREIELFKKESPAERALHIFSRLPEKASVELKEQSIKLSTKFDAALEAVPGFRLPPAAKEIVGAIKSLSMSGDHCTVEFEKTPRLAIDLNLPMIGRLTHINLGGEQCKLSFDLCLDPKDPKSIEIKNINGLSLRFDTGKNLAITSFKLDTTAQAPSIITAIENPLGKWPEYIPLPLGLSNIAPGVSAEQIYDALKVVVAAKTLAQTRELGSLLDIVPDSGLRTKLDGMIKDISKISKDGAGITIERSSWQTTHDFGGPVVQVNRLVRFEVGNDYRNPQLSKISGVNFLLPLPSELGIGSVFQTNLKQVSLLAADSKGDRLLCVNTGNLIDSVRVKLGPNLSPAVDGQGNWCADVVMENPTAANGRDRLKLALRFDQNGQLNLKASEIASIIGDVAWQSSDLSVPGAVYLGVSALSKVTSGVLWLFE